MQFQIHLKTFVLTFNISNVIWYLIERNKNVSSCHEHHCIISNAMHNHATIIYTFVIKHGANNPLLDMIINITQYFRYFTLKKASWPRATCVVSTDYPPIPLPFFSFLFSVTVIHTFCNFCKIKKAISILQNACTAIITRKNVLLKTAITGQQ